MEKRKRKGAQLCYPLEERRLTEAKFGWKHYFPHITQPKLDGERCRAICRGPEVTLLSSTEREIISVPHINEQLARKCFHGELDGELYVKDMNFDEISSIVSRSENLHPDYEQMEFHIFDIVNSERQASRLVQLHEYTNLSSGVLVKEDYDIVFSIDDIMKKYEDYLKSGYEGIIVRHKHSLYQRKRSRFALKFKPKKSDVYKIVGYKQMIGKDGKFKEFLGALILTSDEGTEFSVGSGMTDEFRHKNWLTGPNLIGRFCKINYQHLTPGHVPRFPVFVEILDENPEEEPEEEFGGIL